MSGQNVRKFRFGLAAAAVAVFTVWVAVALFPGAAISRGIDNWFPLIDMDLLPGPACSAAQSAVEDCSAEAPSGCSVFTLVKDGQVFFGGNDDWVNPDSYYWVEPGDDENYGVIWIGTRDNVQQGVNEAGLAYDANSLPRVKTNPHPEREAVEGEYSNYVMRIMHESATVAEVIEWVNTHQRYPYMHDQLHFADASGNAAIISPDAEGELAFTRKEAGNGFLVSTNFNVANPDHGFGCCRRFDTATQMLQTISAQDGAVSVEDAAAVLDAIHVEGGTSWTIESLVADLSNGVIYLYFYHQFDDPVVLNIAEEIANPHPEGPLSALFPEDVQQEATRRYQQAIGKQRRCLRFAQVWLGLVVASLIVVAAVSQKNDSRPYFWFAVVLALGPLGLVVWLLGRNPQAESKWLAALIEASADTAVSTLVFLLVLVALMFFPGAQSSDLIQLLLLFVMPMLLVWLVLQGPLLARYARQGYLKTLSQRWMPAWVAANLGIGGINALAAPLVTKITGTCPVLPVTVWTVVMLEALVVCGALIALGVYFLYHLWAVGRGYRAWSMLAWQSGEVQSPPARKLWWWLLLSFAAVIGGVIVSALIQQMLT